MRVVASDRAVELVRERGGRLYVWRTPRTPGCQGMAFLRASERRPDEVEFDRVPFEPFELHLGRMDAPPSTLQLDARGARVKAYPEGSAWEI